MPSKILEAFDEICSKRARLKVMLITFCTARLMGVYFWSGKRGEECYCTLAQALTLIIKEQTKKNGPETKESYAHANNAKSIS